MGTTKASRHVRGLIASLFAVMLASCAHRGSTTPTKVERAEDIVIHDMPPIPKGSFTPGDRTPEEIEAELRPRMDRKEAGTRPKPRLEDFSDEDERQIGEATARAILAAHPLVPIDSPVSQYVRTVGGILAEGSSRRDLRYHFAILESDVPNAFAAPFGFVFVTTGLLALVENEAELAFVLAHEIAHVEKRHGLQQIIDGWDERERQNYKAHMLELAERDGPLSEEHKEMSRRLSHLAMLVVQSKGKDHETESDLRGLELMSRVGYSPRAALSFIDRLRSVAGGQSKEPDFFMTHPHLDDRYVITGNRLRGLRDSGQLLAERYQRIVRGQ